MKIYKRKRVGAGGNGHDPKSAEVLGSGGDFNVGDYFEGMFPSVGHSTVAKEFLEPGKDFTSSLFRSVIPDSQIGNAILRLHNRHLKFGGDKRHDEMLINKLAELVARFGRARLEGLFGTTNMLSPDMYQQVAGWMLGKNKASKYRVYSNPQQQKLLPRQEVTEEENT